MRPITVGICVLRHRHWMGGRIYLKNLLLAARSLPTKQLRTVLVCSEANAMDNAELGEMVDRVELMRDAKPPGYNASRWLVRATLGIDLEMTRARRQYAAAGIDLLFPFNLPVSYANPRRLAWIPDFQHKYLPELFSEAELHSRDRDFAAIARGSSNIVVSSNAAAADMARFYPAADGKARVMRFATTPEDEWFSGDANEVRKRYGVPDRFFIVCNQFWKHKNHLAVFEAIARLKLDGRGVKVVCTGANLDAREENARHFAELKEFLHEHQLSQDVLILGLVPRIDQVVLLRSSIAVIQPSFFEGWSTVLEDARVFGKQVIASDLAVHREQNLPGARYFDPLDADALAVLMWEVWRNGEVPLGDVALLRKNALQRGREFGGRFFEIVSDECGRMEGDLD